jgi:hypothetical protein
MNKAFFSEVTRQGCCYLPFFILGDTVNYMLIQGVSHDSQYGRPSLSMASIENRMSNLTRSVTPL